MYLEIGAPFLVVSIVTGAANAGITATSASAKCFIAPHYIPTASLGTAASAGLPRSIPPPCRWPEPQVIGRELAELTLGFRFSGANPFGWLLEESPLEIAPSSMSLLLLALG